MKIFFKEKILNEINLMKLPRKNPTDRDERTLEKQKGIVMNIDKKQRQKKEEEMQRGGRGKKMDRDKMKESQCKYWDK